MFAIRRAADRGHADYGWLNTYHTFSFNDYYDPNYMGFRVLRVMNEDRVAPAKGFGTHGHSDMEIISYVLEGALEHKDSLGHGSVLRPGELQRITAGKGILHSEFNPSTSEGVHFYQVWLLPRDRGLPPGYQQRSFADKRASGQWTLVASADGRADSLHIEQDANVYLASLETDQHLSHHFADNRFGWLQVLRGAVNVGGQRLDASDGVAVGQLGELDIQAAEAAEVMLFDLP
jgi:redox-sensitive bicupin YhaK (pirin superfamily)